MEDVIQNTYSMGQFEADVILHERPVLPARFNPKTTRLEVLTEFVEAPAARTTKMNLNKASEDTAQDPKLLLPFQDEAIDFGAMLMGPGRAFKRVEGEAQGEDSGSASALPVAKDWRQVEGGRHILIEAVEYEAFSAYLAGLPQSAGLSHSLRSRFQREWPLIGQAAGLAQPMKVASVTPASPGAVIDYVLVVSQASWTFNSGTTYYVNGWVWINGAMTINGGAIIKYARNASLWVSGTLTCNASPSNRAVLTAVDDNSVGESIGSGAPSGYYATEALELYNVQTYSVLQGLHFRYAQDAIFNYSPYGRTLSITASFSLASAGWWGIGRPSI